MSGVVENIRAKLKRRVSHKDPEPNFDEDSADEETTSYVNKEVEEVDKEGDRYPLGRPNSFLNRMISHGNKKTEDEIAADLAAAQQRDAAKRSAIGSGQVAGAAQSTHANTQASTQVSPQAGTQPGTQPGTQNTL